MSPYAEGTAVTPERSQQEIAGLLRRYGADGFAYAWENGQAMVAFKAHDRQVRFVLPLPSDRRLFEKTPAGRTRSKAQIEAALEQETRRRWRALALAIKAKLEVVETGISSFEEEFLAHIVLPDGRTVAQMVVPEVAAAYDRLTTPHRLLALPSGER